MSKVLSILIFSLIWCFSVSVFSQEEIDPAQSKMDTAAKSASASFEAGQFRAAAKKFAEAFGHLKNYNLKKNEMVAWFKAGECGAAIEAGRLYLSGDVDISKLDRGDVKTVSVRCLLIAAKKFLSLGRIEKCEVQLNEAEALIVADTFSPISGSDESDEIEDMRGQILVIKTEENQKVASTSSGLLGPIVTLSGAALMVGGGIFVGLSKSKESQFTCSLNVAEAQRSCLNPTTRFSPSEFEDAKSTANTLNTMGWIGVGTGVALTGLGIYFWTRTSSDSSKGSGQIIVQPGLKRVEFEIAF